MGYGLDGRGSISDSRNFSLPHIVETGSGAHQASYPLDTGALSMGIKSPGSEADHSPLFCAEVKNSGAISPLFLCLHDVLGNQLYGDEPFLRSCQLRSNSRISQHVVEPEGSLPSSQQSSTSLILSQINPVRTIPSYHPKIELNIIPPTSTSP
jgi:hypothetical protein